VAGIRDTTIGVLGGRWRASVDERGSIQPWDGGDPLHWFVAADDRWHIPATEPAVRQTSIEGTPVVETRVRVPQGDVVHRVYAVADHGGITLIEVRNDSPLPIAVAFAGRRLMSTRPPADVAIEGIELPASAMLFPIGHRASITVGLAHRNGLGQQLPSRLAAAEQVARGWSATCQRASRLELPDQRLVDVFTATRCELALIGPPRPDDDPHGFLLAVHQLVRMTGAAEPWMPEVAQAVASVVRTTSRTRAPSETHVALDAAAAIAHLAGDRRATRDLLEVRRRVDARDPRPTTTRWLPDPDELTGERMLTAVERRLASDGDLLPAGLPSHWLGQNFEVHDVPTAGGSTVSYALRWHGDRPAVLWQTSGERVTLTASLLAPGWSSHESSGETLWPACVRQTAEPGSFS
jgi:hypothetical protein